MPAEVDLLRKRMLARVRPSQTWNASSSEWRRSWRRWRAGHLRRAEYCEECRGDAYFANERVSKVAAKYGSSVCAGDDIAGDECACR
jgi:hypothetical protein